MNTNQVRERERNQNDCLSAHSQYAQNSLPDPDDFRKIDHTTRQSPPSGRGDCGDTLPAHPRRCPGTGYILTIEPLPSDVPAVLRLRGVLKRLLRSYQFRCVEVHEICSDGGADGVHVAPRAAVIESDT